MIDDFVHLFWAFLVIFSVKQVAFGVDLVLGKAFRIPYYLDILSRFLGKNKGQNFMEAS